MTEKHAEVPWEQVKFKQFTADDLAKALRARGLVTAEDIRYNQRVAVGVLQALYTLDLGVLNEFAFSDHPAPKPKPRPVFAEKEVKDG
jgi:hypothetical protein